MSVADFSQSSAGCSPIRWSEWQRWRNPGASSVSLRTHTHPVCLLLALLSPRSHPAERLAFAYLAQCRCDPKQTMTYFTALFALVQAFTHLGVEVPEVLQTLVFDERARFRHTSDDVVSAGTVLGFGRGGELNLELDDEVEDEFVVQAWHSARQRAWREPETATKMRNDLNDALRIVAEHRASVKLLKMWEDEKGTGMSVESAYSTLDVPADVEEGMLLTIFSMRVSCVCSPRLCC